ncbi:MAG: translocation/assembly module TamB domain-containing protein [Geobacteraceae bacterium]|nr:translocation/assembly module TamB domain-containing protein [Geobacteraceae bacterium]
MIRLSRRVFGASLVLALTGSVLAMLIWVMSTTKGTRWLLTTVAPLGGISFSARTIEGSIGSRLRLTELRVGLARQSVEIGKLDLRWKPLLLLSGTVAVQELIMDRVQIRDDSPLDNKPLNLAWPRVTESGQLFEGRIARLKITEFSYRRLQEQPLLITSITGSLTWQESILSINDLMLLSPSGQIQGSVSAGFRQPSLTSDLAIAVTHPLAEMDRFVLQTRRSKTSGKEPFVGNITIAGSAGTRKLLELSGDVGMARDTINLRHLALSRPGLKGRITADGSLVFPAGESLLTLQVMLDGLDLDSELNIPTDLSGTLRFAGTLNSYGGDFSFANRVKGWQAATVSGTYQEPETDETGAVQRASAGRLLTGNLDMDWRSGFALQALLNGRDLNPAGLDPAWKGVANFNATGSLTRKGNEPFRGSVSASLLESRLHGQALTGDLQAQSNGDTVSLDNLALRGKGFDLHASGELQQRISLAATISDFSLLVPGAAGSLRTQGWLRWRDRQLSGAVTGTGSRLAYGGTRLAAITLSAGLDPGPGYPVHISAVLKDLIHDRYRLDAVTLKADGTVRNHSVQAHLRSGAADAHMSLSAGYDKDTWKGEIGRLSGRDASGPWKLNAPASFTLSAETFSLSPLALSAGTGELIELVANLGRTPLSGQLRARWSRVNLARANPWLRELQLSGRSNGSAQVGFLPDKRLTLTGSADISGTFSHQGRSITLQRSLLTVDGGRQGLQVGLDLAMSDGGRLKGSFSSAAPFSLVLPEHGHLTADASNIDLLLLKPWLPGDTKLSGRITGRASGSMLPGQRFDLSGNAVLNGGTLQQQRPDGELKLDFSTARASWDWRGEALSGTLGLTMTDYGQVSGDFRLPLAARFPAAFNPGGPLRATLSGTAREKGLITTLFPGLVQESFGELAVDLAVNGTWEAPQITGKLQLSKAGAYLPTAGIRLRDVQLSAQLEKNRIRVESFRALSGAGHLQGTALITLEGRRVTAYTGTIAGENFQTVNFPELRILSTPRLSFEGTPQKLILRGELRLPELNIIGSQSRTVIAPSSDVIREGVVVPASKNPGLALDVRVKVLLGERAIVKISGIDAQLGGALDLTFSSLDRITSSGEIRVVKGTYRTYGVNLNIVRGRLFFAGGPMDRPTLDFLALRTVGDVRAGVIVSGTLQKPVTRLYSEPAMPDVDVLAYIVLGHPLGSSGEQASLLARAAGALLSSRQAGALQDQIKDKLGLSTLEVQGGVGTSSGAMGYKPLQVTAPGSIPEAQQPGMTETVFTVGKYLTPQLYISYGKSLFTGSNLFKLRYDIFKQVQIETQTGSGESGVDIYYKLEFK